ncbi:hypothetical protein [Anaerophaga thermohalophila]|jgi:hypothetical protein|uniref:hypothetical protein n=1 Tax=Anaerophaga thermohalophila TaxID=177400 RepID=UPI0003036C2C|nr:hypothetical protein [Anaerophaga thermohalophila]
MKNILKTGFMIAMASMLFVACEPQEDDALDIGKAPDESQVDFTITQDSQDEFKYIFENTSSVTGVASWDIAGTRKVGNKVTQRFPLPGDHEITLNLATQGGSTPVTKVLTTEETDYEFLSSEEMTFLSGGADALEGKTWVLDSLAAGHLGVGPAGSEGLAWWAAAPLAKQGTGVLYDDRMTFKLIGFEFIYENHGESYVKDFRSDDPAYSNPEQRDTDYKVDFDPQPAAWNLEEIDGTWYLTLVPTSGPIFPIFDVGAVGNKYKVLALQENKLELVAEGGDGNAWHYQFIPEGYVKPQVEYEVEVTETGNTNEYSVGITNVTIPEGLSVNKVIVDFGNGTVLETTDYTEVLTETYMRAAPYTVTISVVASNETLTSTTTINVEQNHPDYEPFLLDAMIVYNDFSEIMTFPVEGQDCSVTAVSNPDRIYPNKSSMVAKYSKTDQQWANAYMQLPPGYRFDLRQRSTFKVMVYGKAGQQILLKLENTDLGGDAWQTGTHDFIYEIKEDNKWEVAEFDFTGIGAGWDWTGKQFTDDVTTDENFNHDYYNVIRIMCNPGVGEGTHEFYLDELSGPHVEGIKSAQL